MRKRTLLTGVMATTLSPNTMTAASYTNTSTVPALGVAASSESRKSGMSLGMDKRQPADNNKVYYYHYDGLGSIVALSNSYGNIVVAFTSSISPSSSSSAFKSVGSSSRPAGSPGRRPNIPARRFLSGSRFSALNPRI